MSAVVPHNAAASVVIVGAGQAGGRAAEALRQNGHTGSITVVGDEVHPPYERPALSKNFLKQASLEQIAWVRPAAWFEQAGISLVGGRRAQAVDRAAHAVVLDDGARLPYQALVLATGTRPRPLTIPGADHPLVGCLRTIDDGLLLNSRLRPDAHIVVIGAGFIGMEVAATARQYGCAVTVLEMAELPMARGVPPLIGRFYAGLHRARGVDLRTATRVLGIADHGGRAVVETDAGPLPPADAVVAGIGVVPNVELAQAAGLEVDNGIVVDEYGRTADPAVYVAGDASSHYNPLLGRRLRLESWQNAQNQAIAVARNILGADKPYAEVPWFWSDQYELNLQIAGLPQADDEVVSRGVLGEGASVHFHLRGGRLTAAVGVNAARDVRFGKEIIALGRPVSAAELADATLPLPTLFNNLKRSAQAA